MKEVKKDAANKQNTKATSANDSQYGSVYSRGWNLDFVGKRYYFITISAILIVISLISIFTKGFNFGVEFLGGSELIVETTSNNMTVADVRAKVSDIAPEFKDARILQVQAIGQGEKNTFSIVVTPKDENGVLKTYTADEKVNLTQKV
ncbi:MAG TPA: hypothetical protein PLQ59_09490, partial [Fervidobacterium sp.]|nr:hypothetical protein [Fervidobacterium sp.]